MAQADLIGQVLHDSHRVTRVIGRGGMGVVYEAEHVRLSQKRFAIKVLHPAFSDDKEIFLRFRREAEIATSLGHPNIIDVLDFYELDDGRPCMVMELLEGENLYQRQKRTGLLPPSELTSVIRQIGAALQATHDQGIVHRDLKPENIFLVQMPGAEEATVKVLDFGISKIRDTSSVLTQDGMLMGTPTYMSPEQGEGEAKDVDHRSDIFSLGSICYEALYNKLPFEAPTTSGIIYQIQYAVPDPGPEAFPPFDGTLRTVFLRAMAKEKQQRYDSISQFVDALCVELSTACDAQTIMPAPKPVTSEPVAVPVPVATPAERPRTVSTLTSAAGESSAEIEPVRSRRGPMLAVAAVIAVGAVVAVLVGGRSSTKSTEPQDIVAAVSPKRVQDAGRVTPVDTRRASEDATVVIKVNFVGLLPKARVFVDGEPRSDRPLRLTRSAKRHQVVIRTRGYRTEQLEIVADRDQALQIAPKKKPAKRKSSSKTGAKKDWIMDPVIE